MSIPRPVAALFACDGAMPPTTWRGTGNRYALNHLGAEPRMTVRLSNLSHRLLRRVSPLADDLVRIAAYVYVADQMVSRGTLKDVYADHWQRQMYLVVPVRDPDRWNDEAVRGRLERLLRFLSDDLWHFAFTHFPAGNPDQPLLAEQDRAQRAGEPDCAMLFSGGADSLCAAVEAVLLQGRRPVLVSHHSNDALRARQVSLVRALRGAIEGYGLGPAWDPPHIGLDAHRRDPERPGSDPADTTQRTRSFLYGALGVAVASSLRLREVFLPDNGVVSINLPMVAGLSGAQASRTTHPRFFHEFNRLTDRIFESAPVLSNPLALHTRPEALEVLNQAGVSHLLRLTASCAHPRGKDADRPHCGLCSQCIDRRFGVLAEGLEDEDPLSRYEYDIFHDEIPPGVPRLTAVGYYNLALRLSGVARSAYLSEFPGLWRALRFVGTDSEQALRTLVLMHGRHGDAVVRVLDEQTARASPLIARKQLARHCLIRLVHGALPTAGVSADSADEPYVFRREGQFWHAAFAGESRLLKEQIGLKVIAYLLQRPDEEVDLLTLNRLLDGPPPLPLAANALEEQSGVHGQTPGAAPLGPDLDVRTRREYKAHLQELSERINQTSLAGDADTAKRLQREMDAITALLRADTGRGGRRRSTGDPLKRLRERTSQAVRRALESIEPELPDLARHLHQTMRYPRFRAYRPPERLPWRL